MNAKWTELTTTTDWETVLALSNTQISVVLKHSTACPISYNAYKEFDQFCRRNRNKTANYFLVKVIESRAVSNLIERQLNLKHESPQVIFIRNGMQVCSKTHWDITMEWLEEQLSYYSKKRG
jgi:bacillithiol system protein YtxJ